MFRAQKNSFRPNHRVFANNNVKLQYVLSQFWLNSFMRYMYSGQVYAHCYANIANAMCQIWWKFRNNFWSYSQKNGLVCAATKLRKIITAYAPRSLRLGAPRPTKLKKNLLKHGKCNKSLKPISVIFFVSFTLWHVNPVVLWGRGGPISCSALGPLLIRRWW